jgi:hypothetical protein
MRWWLSIGALLAIVVSGLVAADAPDTSIPALIELVRSAIRQHKSDKSVARSLRKLQMGERMSLRLIEELESEGAGPETVAALEFLLENSVSRTPSTATLPFTVPPRPSVEEQKSFFRKLNVNALHYSNNLPNFICTEIVHRYELPPARVSWVPTDVLTVKLTYFGNHEKYELTLVNGRKTNKSYESSGGALAEGDFGSILLEIFAPSSATTFQWDHWTHLRNRLTRVYAYRTRREKSNYRISVGDRNDPRRTVVVGRRGFVYADDETGMVMRISGEAESIPDWFPVTGQSMTMDYDYADVGGKRFLLPLRVDNRLHAGRRHFKNIAEFNQYRKFTGETSISFDVPEPDAATAPPPANEKR